MRRFFHVSIFLAITVVSLLVFGCSDIKKKEKEKPDPAAIEATRKRIADSVICAAYFDSVLTNDSFNGAILIARKGRVHYERYAGAAHLGENDSIHPSTPFHVASSSKPFTAMAILKLQEEGKLHITDTLQSYFPNFPYIGITIQMLLTHRSQLPEYLYFMEDYWKDKSKMASNTDVLNLMIRNKPPLQGRPGKRFRYCNTNYMLLALIVEQVAGIPFPSFLKSRFFDPLQMTNTFVFQPSDSFRITPSYKENGSMEPYTFLDKTYGDKNVYTTVRDMLKWDQALYTHFVSPQIKTAAYQPYCPEKKGMHNYGLGWRMFLLDSLPKIIYHNGWWHGNNSCFYRVVSDSLTIIIQGNRMNNNIYQVNPLVERLTSLRFSPEEEIR